MSEEKIIEFDYKDASPVITNIDEVPEEAMKELSNGRGEE